MLRSTSMIRLLYAMLVLAVLSLAGCSLFKPAQPTLDPQVVMLSIVADPISTYQLKDFKGLSYLPKRILKPSEVKREVFRILGIKEAQP